MSEKRRSRSKEGNKPKPKSANKTERSKPARKGSDSAAKAGGFKEVVAAINKHGHKLRSIPGVEAAETVRPGYRRKGGRITNERAIVVVINPKDKDKKHLFPKRLGGVPVDVRVATPAQQLRARLSAAGAEADAAPVRIESSEELGLPGWDLMEDEDESDEPLSDAASTGLLPYTPPPDVELVKVKDGMRVLCHVSPEWGWKTLRDFFGTVKNKKKNLTIAMYDFTAPHVLEGLASAAGSSKGQVRLILDPKVSKDGEVKADDVWEEEVRDTLDDRLKSRFEFLWAAVKLKNKVTRGIYPTSYHIKVAVSGGRSFWMSSGNWQSSNQPDIDSLDLSTSKILRKYNREWHVVVDHPGLARLYETFIKWDMKQARKLQAESDDLSPAAEPEAMPELLIPAAATDLLEADTEQVEFFKPQEFVFTADKPLQVQPLLTPDNYARHVRALIKSAKKSLYFQNQYIKVGKQPNEDFTSLLDVLLKKIKEGVEVKIILRLLPESGDQHEALQYYAETHHDFNDLSFIKYQPGCHTKGLIVDSKTALVGSHNWSGQGVAENRDASLIFFNADIAKYFERIFLHDHKHLARAKVFSDEEMPSLVMRDEATSPEMDIASGATRVPWDFYEDIS